MWNVLCCHYQPTPFEHNGSHMSFVCPVGRDASNRGAQRSSAEQKLLKDGAKTSQTTQIDRRLCCVATTNQLHSNITTSTRLFYVHLFAMQTIDASISDRQSYTWRRNSTRTGPRHSKPPTQIDRRMWYVATTDQSPPFEHNDSHASFVCPFV
jgi:hypothetical protein